MRGTPNISKEESNILVAIGKLETQMDGMRSDIASARSEIKEINTGITARLLNLESNSVSKIEVNPKLDEIELRLDSVETLASNTNTELRSYWKAVIVGGTIVVFVLGVFEFALQFVFK